MGGGGGGCVVLCTYVSEMRTYTHTHTQTHTPDAHTQVSIEFMIKLAALAVRLLLAWVSFSCIA